MSIVVKLSPIERMLNAFSYVSRRAVKLNDPADQYLKVIKEGLAEEHAAGRREAFLEAAKIIEASVASDHRGVVAAIRALAASSTKDST